MNMKWRIALACAAMAMLCFVSSVEASSRTLQEEDVSQNVTDASVPTPQQGTIEMNVTDAMDGIDMRNETTSKWVRVDASTFEKSLESNPKSFLLDVRSMEEMQKDGYIANATSIPMDQLSESAGELPVEKDTLILLYCRSGNRSQKAAKALMNMGYTNLEELKTGIKGWKAEGLPVEY